MLEQQKLDLGEFLHGNNHRLALVFKDANTTYFAAYSITAESEKVCSVDRLLLVQSIYSGGKFELKTLWIDVPSWECTVLALKSASLKNTMHFYVLSWDRKALQALSLQIDVA